MRDHIFHLCTLQSWEAQSDLEDYRHNSLNLEGFIHASKENQISGVLDRYFDGINIITVMEIDPSLLSPELKYEMASIGEEFPHIYGPVNKSAIVKVKQIK